MEKRANRFAENLKLLRKQAGWSQLYVAVHVGVTQQCVSYWENGKIEPTLTQLWNVADLFDTSVDELIGRNDF